VEVIGVVGDVPYQEGDDRRRIPAVYTSYLQFTYAFRTVMVRATGDPATTIRGVRDAVKRVDPDLALYDLGLLTEQLGGAWAKQRFTSGGWRSRHWHCARRDRCFNVVASLVSERTRDQNSSRWATPARSVGSHCAGMRLPMLGLAVGMVLAIPRAARAVYGISPRPARARSWSCCCRRRAGGDVIPARRATR
jgi:hypothetical protein